MQRARRASRFACAGRFCASPTGLRVQAQEEEEGQNADRHAPPVGRNRRTLRRTRWRGSPKPTPTPRRTQRISPAAGKTGPSLPPFVVRPYVVLPCIVLWCLWCQHTAKRGPGLRDEVCSPKMQWCSLFALADLYVINSPYTCTSKMLSARWRLMRVCTRPSVRKWARRRPERQTPRERGVSSDGEAPVAACGPGVLQASELDCKLWRVFQEYRPRVMSTVILASSAPQGSSRTIKDRASSGRASRDRTFYTATARMANWQRAHEPTTTLLSRTCVSHSSVCGLFITDRSARASKDHHCIFGLQTSSHSPGPRCVTRQ